MSFLPVSLNVSGKRCLIVGGGDIAFRKARILHQYGANIFLVAQSITPDLKIFLEQGGYPFSIKPYESRDLDNCSLVIAATDNDAVNQKIHRDTRQHRIPINVVDNRELSDFIFPSIINRHPVTVAVSSNGESPIIARMLRAKLETLIPSRYGELAAFAGKHRKQVKERINNLQQRLRFWEAQLQGTVAEHLYAGRRDIAEKQFLQNLDAHIDKPVGEVYLVGAGPGDPDLLTFRALRLMQQADVVLYDRLVSAPILELVRKDAQRIYVGKQQSQHAVPQQDINRLLVEYAQQGLRVLRLKGGDPFIFGRGGEEIGELASHGIPFQIVPGITAASGCAAYAGIPLTHRDHAQSVRFLTGHLQGDKLDLKWSELLDSQQTLVFYMGLGSLKEICGQLIQHGRDRQTPIAIIEQGTRPDQRVHISTLEAVPALLEERAIRVPTLTIVGGVVSLHDKLRWFSQ